MTTPLIRAVAASLVLHLAVIGVGWWLPLLHDKAPPHTRRPVLKASIQPGRTASATDTATDKGKSAASPSTPARTATSNFQETSTAAPQPANATAGGQTSAPRFIQPPSFQAIERYPLPLSFSLRIRLYVSSIGLVERVDVISTTGPVPGDLMEEILAELYNSRLTAAVRNGNPDSSSLDLTIGAETGGQGDAAPPPAGTAPTINRPAPTARGT